MNCISIRYELLYQFKLNDNYKVTKCGKVVNTKTGNIIKKTYKSGSVGWWLVLNGKKTFIKKNTEYLLLELIPKDDLPF